MCLIVFAYKSHPDYDLILVGNRDEFYQRPTREAHWWDDHEILGGRDMKAMGTWMGVNPMGKLAAVTNYRNIKNIKESAKSRGDLPVGFLNGNNSIEEEIEGLIKTGQQYNGFNVLLMDEDMGHVSNYENKVNVLRPGVYGLSNGLLDEPWPKVTRAKDKLSNSIISPFDHDDLIKMMQDTDTAPDSELPETGLEIEMERAVSSMCIRTPNYGTCCTTVITIDKSGEVTFTEQSYPVGDRKSELQSYSFQLEK